MISFPIAFRLVPHYYWTDPAGVPGKFTLSGLSFSNVTACDNSPVWRMPALR